MRALFNVVMAAGLMAAAWPTAAKACGGFFCGSQPIAQSGEQIIFATQNGQMEAHVLIQYSGAASQFAWVVPVHALPTLSIGSPAFFRYVAGATQPTFRIQWRPNGSCYPPYSYGGFAGADAGAAADAGSSAGGGVTVVNQGQVGPYDSAILQATDASALTQWLASNGYNLTAAGSAALQGYVGQGYYFVALKLHQQMQTGDIRPIVLSFAGTQPCIPIRLTSIAAQPNMPVTAFVFADSRAVPTNYRTVELNYAKLNWLTYGSNYAALSAAAIAEAGGHAFVTELAGPTASSLTPGGLGGSAFDTQALSRISDPVDFVVAMFGQGFAGDPGLIDLLRKYVPEPASLVQQGLPDTSFYGFIQYYRMAIANDPGRAPFDPVGFANELQTLIVAPLLHAKQIVGSYPYLTRLATEMSPELMTLDPEFDYNAGLGAVASLHTAKATPLCNGGSNQASQVEISLSDGTTFIVDANGGPPSSGPSAEVIEQLGPVGAPVIIQDNRGQAQAEAGMTRRGCGCTGGVDPAAWLGLLALLVSARRRGK